MDGQSLAFATYWRNSLADAEFGQGAFTRTGVDDLTQWSALSISSGQLEQEIVETFFHGEPASVEYVDVILRPQAFLRLVEHIKERTTGAPGVITPLITSAKLSREGYLFPDPATSIPRDLLEPLPKGTFAIGEIEQLDRYRTLNDSVGIQADDILSEDEQETTERRDKYQLQWQSYLDESERLLAAVAQEWLVNPEQYLKASYGYIFKKTQPNGASRHILALYDHLIASKSPTPLFERFAAVESQALQPLLPASAMFSARLGHSGDKFPLATAQRDALSHVLAGQHGEILAVNGPPGTGKTTLVLSIIATLWARAALNKDEPPVVIAMSTNNQAVTNIIEAFGKDFAPGEGAMAGRWLPNIKSFGAYFPAASRRSEANKKYQTEDFFEQIENRAYLEAAEKFFIDKAKDAFPEIQRHTPESIIERLHQLLQSHVAKLDNISAAWRNLEDARLQRAKVSDDIQTYRHQILAMLEDAQQKQVKIQAAEQQWHAFLGDESMIFTLLSWLPAIKRKRRSRIIREMNPVLHHAIADFSWEQPEQIEPNLKIALSSVKEAIAVHQRHLSQIDEIIARELYASHAWKNVCLMLGAKENDALTYEYADQLADTAIRYPIFQLTTHYWEGRWLIDMFGIPNLQREKGKTGRSAVIPRWYRRMKLTPCIVSTCFMLPDKMKISEFKGQNRFEDNYLYDFADLLIVDEAGQVLPEVAAASFALAKQALVIGDTEQISPIWSITPNIDIGNMLSGKLLNAETQDALLHEYAALGELGKSAASGSVMQIAQAVSCYQYDAQMARGMYLYEHRRCYDDIINFCNDLCYQGKLQPRRGAEQNNLFPAMGYLHIDGRGVKANGGSRHNLLEADTIAAWIEKNQTQMVEKYQRPIHEIIGVVTPFGAQVAAIKNALVGHQLLSAEESETAITVGTVHALQGAERPVIIFSSVYSKHDDGSFIDSDNSMLNVAVSRAKDSFLVFGDMDLFEVQSRGVPRGLLAHYLFADEQNRLHFTSQERRDLKSKASIQALQGVEEHDEFLLKALFKAERNLTIVSPWLIWGKLEQTGFLAAMTEAAQRGVEIQVITDQSFNRDRQTDDQLQLLFDRLSECGVTARLVNRVHSKVVMGDEALLCVGSYNWFSASREERYARYDTSLLYRGNNLVEEIRAISHSLDQRMV